MTKFLDALVFSTSVVVTLFLLHLLLYNFVGHPIGFGKP